MNPDSSSNLELQLSALRRMLVLALLLLVIISTSVAWYFRSEKKLVNVQLSQATVNINQWEKQTMPHVNALIGQLQAYSRTHPDILPILAKYGMLPPSGEVPSASVPQTPPKK
jgi:hypothetical protein